MKQRRSRDAILHGVAIRIMSKNEYDVVYDSRYLFDIRDASIPREYLI